jgi:hypothetical protein
MPQQPLVLAAQPVAPTAVQAFVAFVSLVPVAVQL